MTDPNKTPPPDIQEDLETLGGMLLSLNMEDKQTLKDCIRDKSEPPPQLIGLLEAVKVALKYPGARDSIQTALNAPQAFLFNTEAAHASAGGDWEEYARTQITIYGLLRADIKDRIAAAIKDPLKRDALDIGDKYVWGTLCALLTFPTDYRERLAAVFRVTVADLDTLKAETLERRAVEIPIADDQGYLPGMEPTPEERRALEAVKLYEQQRLQYNATALRLSSKLDRKASYFPNSGDAFHTLDIAKSKSLRIKWNVPAAPDGKPQRVTPYDQEVEAAVSNLVDRYGVRGATYEQIFCMMNGTTPGTYIGRKALEDIRRSIWKLNRTEIEVNERSSAGEERLTHGMITDAIEQRIRTTTGQIKGGFLFSRPGLLYAIDKHYNNLLGITREQLNISAGYRAADGTTRKISITALSVTIRRYLIMEIFRIRNTPILAPTANKVTYDAVIKYEADPGLVEHNPDGTIKTTAGGDRILKAWNTPAEKKSIEKQRKHRRELVLDILGHFQATGLIQGFTETTEGRKKTGVIIKVEKTPDALRGLKRSEELKRLQGGGGGKG